MILSKTSESKVLKEEESVWPNESKIMHEAGTYLTFRLISGKHFQIQKVTFIVRTNLSQGKAKHP